MIGKQRAREGFQILGMTTPVSAKNDIGDEHHVVRGTRLRYDEGFGDSGIWRKTVSTSPHSTR